MDKFIDVSTYYLKNYNEDLVVGKTILINVKNIKWIEVKKYSNGCAILVFTEYDKYAYDCKIVSENEAYEKMFVLQRELNK